MDVCGVICLTFTCTSMFYFFFLLFIQWLKDYCKKKKEEKLQLKLKEKKALLSEVSDMIHFEINKFAIYRKGGKR